MHKKNCKTNKKRGHKHHSTHHYMGYNYMAGNANGVMTNAIAVKNNKPPSQTMPMSTAGRRRTRKHRKTRYYW